jgi:uncharacterized protein (TIGR02246 family)
MPKAWRVAAWRNLFAATCVAFLLGGSPDPIHAMETGQAIAEVSARWAEHFNAGDAARLAELYATDAVVFPPSGVRVTGGQIRDYWRSVLDHGARGFRLDSVDVVGDDRIAAQTGQWQATVSGDGGAPVSGYLVNVFERQNDGVWKLHAQMWTPGR